MPIDAVPDHVAVAVPAIEVAAARWRDELGGGWASPRWSAPGGDFRTRQLRYRNDAKLELLEPVTDDGFAARFLRRFGARVHHLTLKVPALLPAVEQLRDEGLEVVDVSAEGDEWHEGFLRPSQVGGLIVQVAWAGWSEDDLPAHLREDPREDAARLLGPTLAHPDPTSAERLWATLGATTRWDGDHLVASWPGAPLDVRVVPGDRPGPVGLRFADAPALPELGDTGPRTLVGR